ncbi:hypothetical protein CEXT_585811 [Caerostris extrusa]|uniref:Uncharacterized protein n=1 Tax=Caerostris extrusa TaxID=172846 RepID=A0AAV4Y8M1_CAEEX|nr:hypothetical protein CEXT_585811 [Caerostris extrusa]
MASGGKLCTNSTFLARTTDVPRLSNNLISEENGWFFDDDMEEKQKSRKAFSTSDLTPGISACHRQYVILQSKADGGSYTKRRDPLLELSGMVLQEVSIYEVLSLISSEMVMLWVIAERCGLKLSRISSLLSLISASTFPSRFINALARVINARCSRK